MRDMTREERLGVAFATGWLALVVLAELISGRNPDLVMAATYAISPLIACAALSVRATAGFGAAAVVLAVGSGYYTGSDGTAQQWVRLVNVALVAVAAAVIAAVRVRREQRLARVVRIAETAQRTILPTLPPRIGPAGVGVRYLSAVEDTLVGGDLYDYVLSGDRACFVVGDVRGKGVAAVEQAARVIRAFRQAAATTDDLAAVAAQVSTYLVPFLDEEEFVTAVLVQMKGPDHVDVVSCGHPAPLLVHPDGSARLVTAPPGLPLGLSDDYQQLTVAWDPKDRLLLYTDGLSEARDDSGQFLRLETLGPQLSGGSIEENLDRLLHAVEVHEAAGRARDDMALMLLENAGVRPDDARQRQRLLVSRG